jgi:RNA polymerase sigma factor (sigma-70 family)
LKKINFRNEFYRKNIDLLSRAKKDPESRNELISSYRDLVANIAAGFTSDPRDLSKLIEKGEEGLAKGIDQACQRGSDAFRKKGKLYSFLKKTIRKEMIKSAAAQEIMPGIEDLKQHISFSKAKNPAVEQEIKFLPSREKIVIKSFFGIEGFSYPLDEIASQIGTTKKNVKRLMTRGMMRLSEKLKRKLA